MSFYSRFAPYYEQVFPFREEVFVFLKEMAGPVGSVVLDIGCGPGHYCGRFAREGFIAHGLDLDSRMIDAATASYSDASFRCMDMEDIERLQGSSFNLVYSIGNVLSHLFPDKLVRFVAAVNALLVPGGCWLFQVVNREAILGLSEFDFPVKRLEGGDMAFHRRYTDIAKEKVLFRFSLTKGDSMLFGEQFTLYPGTFGEYSKIHEDSGFTAVGLHGGLDGGGFSPENSSALVMVFRRGE